RLVLILRDPSQEELESAAAKGKDEDGADKPASSKKSKSQRPWVIDRLYFKEDTVGYLERRRTHLYVFDVASKSMKQVSSGDYDDTEPAWSPDGKWIAYTTQLDPKLFDYGTRHIAVVAATGGQAKVLTLELDRNGTNPRFAPDGKSIYFVLDDDCTQNLAQANIASGKITRPIAGRVTVESYSLAKDGTSAANLSTPDRPYELFAIPGGHLTRLTKLNDAWLAQFQLSTAEYVSFVSKDGTTVHGYLYKPVDYVSGKKYPAILRPHGGPQEEYEAEFQDLAQLFAANGYVVLYPNPRGSTGYGQDFCKA